MTSSKNTLEDFQQIKEILASEHKAYVRSGDFGLDGEYVRDLDDAHKILNFLCDTQHYLNDFFRSYPSLISFFDQDFVEFKTFTSRQSIFDLCFVDDCLFPEKDMYYFGQDGAINSSILDIHLKSLKTWCEEKKQKHETTQEFIKTSFNAEKRLSELSCRCVACSADYRAKLREYVLEECQALILQTHDDIAAYIHEENDLASDQFERLRNKLSKFLQQYRYRLRRSTINRLESQIKKIISDQFSYPSTLAVQYTKVLEKFWKEYFYQEELSEDIISPEEYDKFYKQITTNLWRHTGYLQREFKKFIRSIVVLKKKDVSSKILKDYLGEFWNHSQARTLKRKIIYHMGPTNSGKTYHAINELCESEKGCYLAPLRLLASELYDTMNAKGVKTSLLTGEEVIDVEGATHYSSTIEMARFQEVFDCVVIDEIQMITDSQRGWAWTRALVNIFSPVVHVCGDPSVLDLVQKIVELCGDELEIRTYERMTELKVEKKPTTLGELERGDALIVFSRRNALKYKADLERIGFKVSIVYGRLSPEVRREQARKFDSGETDIIVSTDAIAMGMNLPIKRIVFSTLSKFIDSQEHPISQSEIKQIAGRAGRYKRFPVGFATCLTRVKEGLEDIQEALSAELDQREQSMVGPDLEIYSQVNNALIAHNLPRFNLSEFLRLFNTMTFKKPFYCVDLREMIELAEMVEEADSQQTLKDYEIFGFSCAPVNQGLLDHVQYFVWILNHYVGEKDIYYEDIDVESHDIDYLETSIKCVELYQWLSRHFNNKHFDFDPLHLNDNKQSAIEKLNTLLSKKIIPTCSSCGCQLPESFSFPICDTCFKKRRFGKRRGGYSNRGRQDSSFKKKTGGGKKKPFNKRNNKKRVKIKRKSRR